MNGLRSRLARTNRYLLATSAGLGICILLLIGLGILWRDLVFGAGWEISFYQNLLTSVVFFGLVGVAAFVQQIYSYRGDILQKRIQYLFASNSVSAHLIEYFQKVVTRNALYSVSTQYVVEVHEYHTHLKCYRVSMENSYELRNVFGDLSQDELMPFNFVPDLISTTTDPLAELVSLTTTSQAGVMVEHVAERIKIPAEGLQLKIRVRVPPGEEVNIKTSHWTWALNAENSGFSIRRFSEHTRVVLRNRSNVTVRAFRPHNEGEVISLAYGEDVVLYDETRVPEMRRFDFSWLPPVEHPQPAELADARLHPLLLDPNKF